MTIEDNKYVKVIPYYFLINSKSIAIHYQIFFYFSSG